MTPSPWALERATRILGVARPMLSEEVALALDAARRDGAERMREAAADLSLTIHGFGSASPAVISNAIRALDAARVLAGEEE